jgi:uncharacterized protein YbbC (DUF1343 family)
MPLWLMAQNKKEILPGAYQSEMYITLLLNKRVGVFTNHTAIVNKKHLIDTLLMQGIHIQKIFTPEHGLRGTADAGEETKDGNDPKTGIKIVSLYGKKYGPDAADLEDIDILVFDIQDVGTRFYTYISSLQYFMEAAKENNKPLIILDRPNPNGHYVDGPVLEKAFSSFVGKNSVPIVYGMTIGEYATMLNAEQWLKINTNKNWSLTIIPCKNYDHLSMYTINMAPSPNLPDMQSIYWYPSTCLVEGTILSEGRGTEHAFAYIGHPLNTYKDFSFTPISRVGATQPKLKDQLCYGWDLTKTKPPPTSIDIELFIEMYKAYPEKDSFFIHTTGNTSRDYYFNKLAGNSSLMEQIQSGVSATAIRTSWQKGILRFKKIRKKYLLYKDFE